METFLVAILLLVVPVSISFFIKFIQGSRLTFDERCLLQMKSDLKKHGASQNLLSNSCVIGLYAIAKNIVTKGNNKNPLTFKQRGAVIAGCDQVASWACRISREEKVPDVAYIMGVAHILEMNEAVNFSRGYIEYVQDSLGKYGFD